MTTRLRQWAPPVAVSFLVALSMVTPFFWMGNATGHDFQYHAASWLDAAGQWKQGVLYPRWTEWANYGFGEPRFIFYPPLSWMLGAALGLLGPWNKVPVVFIVLVQTIAGVNAFALARRVLPSRGAALFCSACYVANPYALLIAYWRSDFAELLADAFFPLLVLHALKLCEWIPTGTKGNVLADRAAESPNLAREAPPYRTIVAFAIVFAVIWLSNAPAGVIASYSVAALFAFAALLRRSGEPVKRGAAALVLGLALTAGYLLPAAYEQRWVNIAQALSTGLLPSENFLYTTTLDAEHTLFNWIASTLAILMMVLAGFAAIAAHRRNRAEAAVKTPRPDESLALNEPVWLALLLFWAIATVLMLPISSPLWALLPKLRFVQFPWRWMSLLAVPFAIFLGYALAVGRRRWVWIGVTFGLLSVSAIGLVRSGWWDTDDIPVLRQAIADGQGFEGTDEYDPLSDDHTNIPATKTPEVQVMDTDTMPGPNRKPTLRVERWSPEEKDVTVSAPQACYLGLRLLNYPSWRVELNGAPAKTRGGEDYNMMIVWVPAGDSLVRVRFTRTWDRTAGVIVTFASILLAGCLFWLERRKLA